MAYNFFAGMLGNSNGNSSTGIWNMYSSLGDYNSIQSGTYKKLLSAYYKNNTDDVNRNTATTTAKKNQTTAVEHENMTTVKKKTDVLQEAAGKLMEKGKDSVFEKEDKSEMVSAVKEFVNAYNNTLTETGKAKDYVSEKAVYMTNSTKAYEKSLTEIGITIGEDDKLSLDEDKLKSADTDKVKGLLNSSSSFVGQTARKAAKIGAAAQNVVNGVGTYSSTGNYNYMNMNDFFNNYI